jgi:anti-sigma factor RsiW
MIFRRRAEHDHRYALANLSAYMDDRLGERETKRLEKHIALCRECAQELGMLQATVDLLRQTPSRSVPRSFVLPVAAQTEQVRYRRLNGMYGLMRGATVAVSLLFVLLVSGDMLIASGAIPLGGKMAKSEAVSQQYDVVPEMAMATERAAPAEAPAPEMGALAMPQVQTESAQAPADAEDASSPDGAPAAAAGIAAIEPEPTLSPEEIARRDAAPPGRGEEPTPEGIPAPPGIAAVEPEPTPGMGILMVEEPAEPDSESVGPPPADEPGAEPAAGIAADSGDDGGPAIEPLPEAPAMPIAPESTQETEAASRLADQPGALDLSQPALWQAWQNIRLIWTTLLGALCVLLGGTLWLGYRSRL